MPAHAFGQRLHPVILAAADIQQLLGELPDIGPIRRRHTHHLRDHHDRQRCRQVAHDVHMPFRFGRVEQLLHRIADERAPGFHLLGREVAVHHPAHLEMLRSVVLDELVALVVPDVVVKAQIGLIDGGIGRPRVVPENCRRKQFVMAGQPDHVVVAGDDPQGICLVPMDRVCVSQPAIVGVGIGDDIRCEHVIRNGRDRQHRCPPWILFATDIFQWDRAVPRGPRPGADPRRTGQPTLCPELHPVMPAARVRVAGGRAKGPAKREAGRCSRTRCARGP